MKLIGNHYVLYVSKINRGIKCTPLETFDSPEVAIFGSLLIELGKWQTILLKIEISYLKYI